MGGEPYMMGPGGEMIPDLIPFIPDEAKEPAEPTHYGYDSEFAIGAFTT